MQPNDQREQASATERRNLRLLVAGNSVSTLGSSVYLIAVTLLLKSMTESVFTLGLFQFVALAPAFLASPIAGALVDRVSRRGIIVISDILRGALMVGAGFLLFAPSLNTPAFILSVSFLAGLGNALFVPAVLALLPSLVRRDRLHAATGFRAATNQAANLIGNALGGLLFAVLGAPLLFVLNGVTFIASGIQERFISTPGRPPEGPRRSIISSARAGLVAISKDKPAGRVILSQAGLFVLSPVLMLSLPFLVIDDLGLPPFTVGLFFALALAAGIVSFILLRSGSAQRVLSKPLIAIAYGALAGGLGLLSLSTRLSVLIVVAVVFGAAASLTYLFTTTWIQIRVPPAMHGRYFAVMEAATAVVAPVSYLVAGSLLELLGVQWRWLMFATSAVAAGAWALVSALRGRHGG